MYRDETARADQSRARRILESRRERPEVVRSDCPLLGARGQANVFYEPGKGI